jgi:hypothetical protein
LKEGEDIENAMAANSRSFMVSDATRFLGKIKQRNQ